MYKPIKWSDLSTPKLKAINLELTANCNYKCSFCLNPTKDFRKKGNISEKLVNKILDELHLNPNDGFYVGDSNVDIETARNAKLKAVILNYGYGNKEKIKEAKPDFVFEKFSDLFKLI